MNFISIYKKNVVIFFTLFLSVNGIMLNAQNMTSNYAIFKYKDNYYSIQYISDNIVRIRYGKQQGFPESLAERYSILKTNFGILNYQVESNSISNKKFKIIFNENSGVLSVQDLNGKSIIEHISVFAHHENPQKYSDVEKSIVSYFSNLKSGGGIIGDENYIGNKSEKDVKDEIKIHKTLIEFKVKNSERFYGGGATSRKNIQHRGEILRMWATYQQTEIPIPFIMSHEGWGVLNNTTSLNFFDVAHTHNDKMYIINTDGTADFFLFIGGSMKEILGQYVQLTGNQYLLPRWAYGLAFGSNTQEKMFDVLNNAARFREETIPCDLYWLEPQWMEKNYDFSTSKNWNLDKFPAELSWDQNKRYENKLLFIGKLHKMGFKLALWLCIDHDLSIEEEDRIADRNKNKQSGLEHWFPHLLKFVDQGVDGFKLDPGMTLNEHPDREYYNGKTDKEMHNLNQVLLSKQMHLTFREHKNLRSFHHYCGGYFGSHHWGASTSGDNGGGKNSLFDQLNLGMSAYMNTSVDVMEVHDDDFKPAIHFGFFLPWVQVNSWYAIHHPWFLDSFTKDAFRFYDQLRHDLNPYIYSTAIEGTHTGLPIMRPMPLEYPNDINASNLINQYMFGENLLVGVFSDSIYLPEGNWIDFWTNQKIAGGKRIEAKYPKNRGGQLFIKSGAIIPFQKKMQYIGEIPLDTLIIKVFPENKSSFTLYEDDGITYEYEKGIFESTLFRCSRDSKSVEFEIIRKSDYYFFNDRTFILEIMMENKPVTVEIEGKIINNWNYVNNKLSLITSCQKNKTQKINIKAY
jgi:alpha-glucosidase (family GH31 glycosyl hydrolase)